MRRNRGKNDVRHRFLVGSSQKFEEPVTSLRMRTGSKSRFAYKSEQFFPIYGTHLFPASYGKKPMLRFLAGVIFCYGFITGCKDYPKVDDDLVYETLNQVIKHDSLFVRIVCSKFIEAKIPGEIQKKFFPGDEDFIRYQLERSAAHSIDTGKLVYHWSPEILQKSFVDTSCSKDIFYRFSYPVFSRDLKTVVVVVKEDCNCAMGGSGYSVIYRRENGKWVEVLRFDDWIS
jgi:hypothetical protein